MAKTHILYLVPAKDAVLRQAAGIFHNFLVLCTLFVIDVIADDGVRFFFHTGKLAELCQKLRIRFLIYPVIAVHNLVVQTGRMLYTGIDPGAMAAIFLMDDLNDTRMLCCQTVRDHCGIVLGTIIHKDDFHLIPTRKQAFHTVFHIAF